MWVANLRTRGNNWNFRKWNLEANSQTVENRWKQNSWHDSKLNIKTNNNKHMPKRQNMPKSVSLYITLYHIISHSITIVSLLHCCMHLFEHWLNAKRVKSYCQLNPTHTNMSHMSETELDDKLLPPLSPQTSSFAVPTLLSGCCPCNGPNGMPLLAKS